MNAFGLTLSPRYAGLFVAQSASSKELITLEIPNGVTLLVYSSPQLSLSFLIGDQHTESVIQWLQRAHEVALGSSFLTGIIGEIDTSMPYTECYFFRWALDTFNETVFHDVIQAQSLSMVDPRQSEIYILTPSVKGLELSRSCAFLGSANTGLILEYAKANPETTKKPKRPYDPVGAQVNEVLFRSSVALKDQLKHLQLMWPARIRSEPPLELRNAESDVDAFVASAKQLERAESPITKNIILQEIDVFAQWMAQASRICTRLMRGIADYDSEVDPWITSCSYSEQARPMMLTSAKNFVEEIADRCGLREKTQIIPIVGSNFTAYMALLPRVDWLASPLKNEHPSNTVVLTMPKQVQLRLGALPILAHEVAHIVIRDHSELMIAVASQQFGDEETSIYRLIGQLDLPTSRDSAAERMDYARKFETAVGWSEEILCDLAATLMAGPAYVYAACRFITGTLSEFTEKPSSTNSHPPLVERIRICLDFLSSIGFETTFESAFIDSVRRPFPAQLSSKLKSIVGNSYLPAEHTDAIGRVKQELASGRPSSGNPVQILNALWDGVMKRDVYVNEIALAISLQASSNVAGSVR
jgi:hypothetical protein